jgi:ABC-type antimicrobial peptide transport system permease subunit
VVREHRVTDVDQQNPLPSAFLPYPYLATANNGITVRTTRDPAAITASLRRVIHEADAGIPIFAVKTMDQVRRDQSWERPFFGKVFTVFGLIAVLLAVIGVYGVISYGVTQRTREIGVRMALGARATDVLRLVVGQGIRVGLIGVALGLAGSFAVTGVIRSALYQTSPTDPVSFAGVATLLMLVACLASWLPARRAARLEPMRALREE